MLNRIRIIMAAWFAPLLGNQVTHVSIFQVLFCLQFFVRATFFQVSLSFVMGQVKQEETLMYRVSPRLWVTLCSFPGMWTWLCHLLVCVGQEETRDCCPSNVGTTG
jgi:hypothetical protein